MIRPAVTLGDHLLGGQLGTEECALQIDVEHEGVLLLGGVEDGGAGLDPGVVDHDVQLAEGAIRRCRPASAGRSTLLTSALTPTTWSPRARTSFSTSCSSSSWEM